VKTRALPHLIAGLVLASNAASAQAAPAARPYDVLIRRGTVVDGTGASSFTADVAIAGDRIARVSRAPLDPSLAGRVIDAGGLVVSPGFIDLHTHLEPLLQMPDAQSHVRQGVTLALGGPDGGGPWPFGAYLDSASRAKLAARRLTGPRTS